MTLPSHRPATVRVTSGQTEEVRFMKALLSTAITVGMLALGVGAVVAQSGSDLFQQALVKERTDGNMAAAIALYQTIVQKHAADQALAARALVRMGHCYDKLGHRPMRGELRARRARVSESERSIAEARAWLDAHPAGANPQAGSSCRAGLDGKGCEFGRSAINRWPLRRVCRLDVRQWQPCRPRSHDR